VKVRYSPVLFPQLIKAIKEQEDINFRLRQYMDKIILSILDHNPSILEIKK
jgi:Rab11 family-interacting protein 3/4